MTVEKNKAFKYRIYPDAEQRVLFAKTFGCVRFTYNHCLEEQEWRYQNGEKYPQTVLTGRTHFNLPLREHPYSGKPGEKKKTLL